MRPARGPPSETAPRRTALRRSVHALGVAHLTPLADRRRTRSAKKGRARDGAMIADERAIEASFSSSSLGSIATPATASSGAEKRHFARPRMRMGAPHDTTGLYGFCSVLAFCPFFGGADIERTSLGPSGRHKPHNDNTSIYQYVNRNFVTAKRPPFARNRRLSLPPCCP
jgi:hypothetical protein